MNQSIYLKLCQVFTNFVCLYITLICQLFCLIFKNCDRKYVRIETLVTNSEQCVPVEPSPVRIHVGPKGLPGHLAGVGLQGDVKLKPEEEAETVRHHPTRGSVTGRGVVTHGA